MAESEPLAVHGRNVNPHSSSTRSGNWQWLEPWKLQEQQAQQKYPKKSRPTDMPHIPRRPILPYDTGAVLAPALLDSSVKRNRQFSAGGYAPGAELAVRAETSTLELSCGANLVTPKLDGKRRWLYFSRRGWELEFVSPLSPTDTFQSSGRNRAAVGGDNCAGGAAYSQFNPVGRLWEIDPRVSPMDWTLLNDPDLLDQFQSLTHVQTLLIDVEKCHITFDSGGSIKHLHSHLHHRRHRHYRHGLPMVVEEEMTVYAIFDLLHITIAPRAAGKNEACAWVRQFGVHITNPNNSTTTLRQRSTGQGPIVQMTRSSQHTTTPTSPRNPISNSSFDRGGIGSLQLMPAIFRILMLSDLCGFGKTSQDIRTVLQASTGREAYLHLGPGANVHPSVDVKSFSRSDIDSTNTTAYAPLPFGTNSQLCRELPRPPKKFFCQQLRPPVLDSELRVDVANVAALCLFKPYIVICDDVLGHERVPQGKNSHWSYRLDPTPHDAGPTAPSATPPLENNILLCRMLQEAFGPVTESHTEGNATSVTNSTDSKSNNHSDRDWTQCERVIWDWKFSTTNSSDVVHLLRVPIDGFICMHPLSPIYTSSTVSPRSRKGPLAQMITRVQATQTCAYTPLIKVKMHPSVDLGISLDDLRRIRARMTSPSFTATHADDTSHLECVVLHTWVKVGGKISLVPAARAHLHCFDHWWSLIRLFPDVAPKMVTKDVGPIFECTYIGAVVTFPEEVDQIPGNLERHKSTLPWVKISGHRTDKVLPNHLRTVKSVAASHNLTVRYGFGELLRMVVQSLPYKT